MTYNNSCYIFVSIKTIKMIHRKLTDAECSEFRQWARENYQIGDTINTVWHPIIIHEIGIMYQNYYYSQI